MQKDFWLERWQREEIGFHEGSVNTYLSRFWNELDIAKGVAVFVPLCGKSADMKWLREQGYGVEGVELSDIAAKAFFAENNYVPKIDNTEKFECYAADNIKIYCGDYFDLSREELKGASVVYDRASMVALPPEMRGRYVSHLVGIMPAGTQILLIAYDYPQSEMKGPPFAVSADEVESLYGKYAEIRLLEEIDALPLNPRFQKNGLTRLQERIYLLKLK